jgi:3-deoxy-D-manno-octulosonic-acid transferase
MNLTYLPYRLLIIIFSPALFGYISWLAIKNKSSRYFWQRLGFGNSHLPKKCLWFHCASVGEVNTLLPLIKNIHQKNKQRKILITTNTVTSASIVRQQNLDYLFHCYLPFDWKNAVNRFLSTVNPVSLHVVETEIWPTLFTVCHNKNIPIDIINARLSKKTTAANNWIKSLLKYSLSKVNAIYARSEDNADAYRQLGAPADIVSTLGNLKFTTLLRNEKTATRNNLKTDREYVLLASTHQDEELQIYNVWKNLNRDELLVIAPRHPERCDSIIKQLDCDDIAIRKSNQNLQSSNITEQTKVFILNTVGELTSLFEKSKVVIMGGSFIAIGGHNILEPASYNKAIITGPHMENFKDELELMKNKQAILQTDSYEELQIEIAKLLDDENYRNNLEKHTEKLTHDVEKILEDYSKLMLTY